MNLTSDLPSSYKLLQERKTEVPEHFAIKGIKATEAGAARKDFTRLLGRASKFPLFKITVDKRTYVPTKPLVVQITYDGEWFLADNVTLGLTGIGKSFEAAVLDLEQHIVHFWRYYDSISEERLMDEARRLKAIYSDLFRQV
jgi:hypothetical protein